MNLRFQHNILHLLIVVMVVFLITCSRPSTPKPYGYFRLTLPVPTYKTCYTQHASFVVNQAAELVYTESDNKDLFNIHYPQLNATIHCTYMPIQHNLPALLTDAQEMVYSHTIKASAIPEQEYIDTNHNIYGMLYELQGNTATPAQFYLTDSTRNFFRASVYINTIPNQDSLAPLIDYMIADTRILMESFRWK